MSLPSPTPAHVRRFQIMADVGCIACIIEGEHLGEDRRGTPPDIHHRLNGYRMGHGAFQTQALCPWHHRGLPPDGMTVQGADLFMGPSLARSPGRFRDRYGTQAELSERQEKELRLYCERHQITLEGG